MKAVAVAVAVAAAVLGAWPSVGHAAEQDERRFRLSLPEGKVLEMVSRPDQCLTLTAACLEKDCEAKRALARASLKKVPRDRLAGGANPGSVVCATALGGEVQLGIHGDGSREAICRFPDGSAVGAGGVACHARKNDGQ